MNVVVCSIGLRDTKKHVLEVNMWQLISLQLTPDICTGQPREECCICDTVLNCSFFLCATSQEPIKQNNSKLNDVTLG